MITEYDERDDMNEQHSNQSLHINDFHLHKKWARASESAASYIDIINQGIDHTLIISRRKSILMTSVFK